MWRLRSSLWIILLSIAFTASAPLLAQISTSSLTGQVTDPSGSTIAHAHVVVLNKSTGFSRSGETDDTGYYNFQALPIGLYTGSE